MHVVAEIVDLWVEINIVELLEEVGEEEKEVDS
jgi:hypothetical protein